MVPWVYRWLSVSEQTNHIGPVALGVILPAQGGPPADYDRVVTLISLSSKPKTASAENPHAQNDTAPISRELETARTPYVSSCVLEERTTHFIDL